MARLFSLVADVSRRFDHWTSSLAICATRSLVARFGGWNFALDPLSPTLPPLSSSGKQVLQEIFGPLFAVPKKYVTLNVRKRRRGGLDKWAPHGLKLLRPKSDIVSCQTCGHFHELRYLCEKCYERVKAASKPIQEAMVKAFEGRAVDQEVRVRYRGEGTQAAGDTTRFVEVDEPRPQWFTDNLLSKPHRTELPRDPVTSSEGKST